MCHKDYIDWLWNIVKDGHENYYELFMILNSTPFRYIISYDYNRYSDGLRLRDRYIQSNNLPDDLRNSFGDCSVLEMILALVIAGIEHFGDYDHFEDEIVRMFWDCIDTLGLSRYTDDYFDIESSREVRDILERFMDRTYSPNGDGGLFYIQNPREDLRRVEIWKQLCWYMTQEEEGA